MNAWNKGVSVGVAGLLLFGLQTQPQLHAQDADTSPLLELLAYIPAENNRRDLYFADRQALEEAYTGVQVPPTFADFQNRSDSADATDEQRAWQAWFKSVMNVYIPTAQYMNFMDTLPEVLGIDYFDIDQELQYGVPPESGLILVGEFGVTAAEAAFANRGYEQVGNLWCFEGDCSTGMAVSVDNINPTNPFGGQLGRDQPTFIQEGMIASSTVPFQLGYDAEGSALEFTTLAEETDIVDTVHALHALGTVIQVSMFDGDVAGVMNFVNPRFTPEQIDAIREALALDDAPTISPYSMVTIADVVTEDAQLGVMAFAFDSVEDAEISLAEMVRRIETTPSVIMSLQTYAEIIASRSATVSTQVFEGENHVIGLVLLTTPKATVEQILVNTPQNPQEAVMPGILYRLLSNMMLSQDSAWFAFDTEF